MISEKFDYIRANSVDEAIQLLDKHGMDAKIIAGGHSLLPAMKLRLNSAEVLIDISKISAINEISESGDSIVIGAGVTHAEIMRSDLVKSNVSLLSSAASMIGDVQVRNRGTIGGSIAHADPASDYPACLLAAEATVEVIGKNGTRKISAADFFVSMFTTALEDDEVIVAVHFPKGSNGNYLKFFQSASRFAVVGVAVVKNGSTRVAINGVSDTAYRASAVEEAINSGANASDAAEKAVDGIDVLSDHFADEKYRSHLAKVYTKRALES